MRPLRSSPGLLRLLLPLCLAGCASTTGGVPSNIKTVASVGDKALPVVTGEPGSTVVADDHIPERTRRAEGRISGRVFDENGDPLPDVRVRLALGNTPGGNFTSATTDRTGAFTLPGLRPGSAYTVIAEWEEGQEYLSGRSSVRAPDTDVRITLGASESGTRGVADARPSGRVRSVSERDPLPDEEEFDSPRMAARNKPRVNTEDLPPAPEAELYEPPARSKGPASSASPSPAPARSGASSRGVHWRAVGADGPAQGSSGARDLGASVAPHDSEAREAGILAANPLDDEEERNPLPPALEPEPADSAEEENAPLPPPVRKRRRSSSARRPEVDRQAPAHEPGQMSVVPPASEPEESLPAPASDFPDGDPLPPAREPGQEGPGASTDANGRGPLPEPRQEPGLAFDAPAPAGLPPAVESGPTATFAAAPQPESGQAADPFAQAEAAAPLASGALPGPIESGPVEASSDFPVPPATNPVPPGQTELAAEASPFESSPFDSAPSEPSPFDSVPPSETAPAASPALAMATAADNDQSVFENPETAMAPAPPAETPGGDQELVDTRKRPTWKDLATVTPRASIPKEGANPKATTTRPVATPPAVGRRVAPTQTSARAAPATFDVGVVFCKYDPKHRKIEDFRLPDLEGRPVRFQDLGADLVLIDFWGTWCQPCLKSVPHLVDLQKRMDPTKLKVIGIACEQGPTTDRAQTVTREVQRLGINYPVLLSGMDGPCPLQDALKVQTYPTLILVDRQGQVLWRAQGATPATLARLDRVIASANKPGETRRY